LEQAQGEVGGQHSIPLKNRADEETYTNTHSSQTGSWKKGF